MTTIESLERIKMPEGTDEETKQEKETPEDLPPIKDYLQATIVSMAKDIKREKRPIWEVLNDPQVRAIADRRAFLGELRKKTSLAKYEQEQQQRLKEMQILRQQRREQRLEEVHPESVSRLTNFFKERAGKVIEFLSQPIAGVERTREVERQSYEVYKDIFKDAGKRLRGAAGYFRGIGAALGKGVVAGAKAFSTKFRESSRNQGRPVSGGLKGGPPGPI